VLRAHVLVTIMLAALAAACMGGSHDGPLSSRSTTAAATRMTVTYAIGPTFRSRERVPGTCVPGARCFTERWRGISPHMWERMARQTLSCSPDGGTYARPANACAALEDLSRRSGRSHAACSCPAPFVIGALARGVYAGHRVTVSLDFCSACGLGRPAIHDIHVLTPRGLPG
jgi:Subtilisin inhibitor-like